MSVGQYQYDWQERVNVERMRRERLARARSMMKKRDLDVLLCMEASNVRYITSTATPPWMIRVPGWRYTLLIRDEDPVLWEHGDIRYHTMRHCPWLKDRVKYSYTWIRGQPGPQTEHVAKLWAEDIKETLKKYGGLDGRLGLDIHEAVSVKALKDVGIEPADGQSPMLDARVIKTEDEIECLRIAAAICEAIFEATERALKPGIREIDLVALGHQVAWSMGMDDVIGFTVCSGPNTWPNYKFFTDRIIRPRDLVTLDVGGAGWNGYKTCYYRTFCLGSPTPKQREFYSESLEWLQSAIRATRPGATTEDLVKDWPDATKIWGYESEWEAIANEWGHGLGLSLYEPPSISRAFSLDFPFKLQENMTFALETQQGTLEDGGVRIEEMLRVTSSGVEVLSKYPVEEIIEV